jgi:hypothetical protein
MIVLQDDASSAFAFSHHAPAFFFILWSYFQTSSFSFVLPPSAFFSDFILTAFILHLFNSGSSSAE